MAPPAEKKQKTEETKEEVKVVEDAEMKDAEEKPAAEKPKVVEPPKELETDAAPVAGAKNKDDVTFLTPDTTLNVLPSANGSVLMSLNEGGIQHLMAGARASVGVSKGRYMFEVKVLECVNVADPVAQGNNNNRMSKNLVRVGFSTAGSSLILGATADSICFDSDGAIFHDKKRTVGGQRFGRDNVMAVLLNLDEKSENANTVSLFKDGKRVSQPQALPEGLKGKTLFPHIGFKNASVHVNFGPTPLAPLPFTCHMVQDAAKAHVKVTAYAAPADGKYDVAFPVSLPDEGTFAWLDMFLEKNPTYTELSDRMIMDWAQKSGVWKNRGYENKSCNDKPEGNFQVKELDDGSIRKALFSIAPLQSRNYIVMEVRGNLMKDTRKELLSKFEMPGFKKTALVVVGEPTADFKKKTAEYTLKAKQEASDRAFKVKKMEEKRQKMVAKQAKEAEKKKNKLEKERAKKLAEAKKKMEAEKKKKEAAAAKKEGEEEEQKDEEEEKKEEPEPMEVEEEEEEEAVDLLSIDVFGVEDILDVGAKMPLFKEFGHEDWTLMSLRFELHLLAHAFRKDVDDPERPGIPLDHLPFYYQKYFHKNLTTKEYGVESVADIIKLVSDAVYLTPQQVLDSQLSEEMETFAVFATLTEEARRFRLVRIDLGEEDAKLKIAVVQASKGGAGGPQTKGLWGKGAQTGAGAAKGTWGGVPQQPQQAFWGSKGDSAKGGKGTLMGKGFAVKGPQTPQSQVAPAMQKPGAVAVRPAAVTMPPPAARWETPAAKGVVKGSGTVVAPKGAAKGAAAVAPGKGAWPTPTSSYGKAPQTTKGASKGSQPYGKPADKGKGGKDANKGSWGAAAGGKAWGGKGGKW
mmetsp:Transcript_90704/g.290750  ORF Transcript_90704/g.290750 Transcript_90704/m.290750 type:complete len:856 (-) Transcript_90704:113-2680(-)